MEPRIFSSERGTFAVVAFFDTYHFKAKMTTVATTYVRATTSCGDGVEWSEILSTVRTIKYSKRMVVLTWSGREEMFKGRTFGVWTIVKNGREGKIIGVARLIELGDESARVTTVRLGGQMMAFGIYKFGYFQTVLSCMRHNNL